MFHVNNISKFTSPCLVVLIVPFGCLSRRILTKLSVDARGKQMVGPYSTPKCRCSEKYTVQTGHQAKFMDVGTCTRVGVS